MATHVLIVVQDGMVYISTQVHSIYNPYLRPADEYNTVAGYSGMTTILCNCKCTLVASYIQWTGLRTGLWDWTEGLD